MSGPTWRALAEVRFDTVAIVRSGICCPACAVPPSAGSGTSKAVVAVVLVGGMKGAGGASGLS